MATSSNPSLPFPVLQWISRSLGCYIAISSYNWRESSAGKSACCLCRGPGFRSLHPQMPVSPPLTDPLCSSGLHRHEHGDTRATSPWRLHNDRATVSWCIDPHVADGETWASVGGMFKGGPKPSLLEGTPERPRLPEQKALRSCLTLLFCMVLDHSSIITPFSFMRLEV